MINRAGVSAGKAVVAMPDGILTEPKLRQLPCCGSPAKHNGIDLRDLSTRERSNNVKRAISCSIFQGRPQPSCGESSCWGWGVGQGGRTRVK